MTSRADRPKLLTRRALLAQAAALGCLGLTGPVGAIGVDWPVRFGLTSVVVRENLAFFRAWGDYLRDRLGRPVEFVQRRSYREVMQLLESGEVNFAWICGYPFVRAREAGLIDLVAVPEFQGAPLYRSYIIVHRDSPHQTLEDLGGAVFAFSDPDSNSGYLVPRERLATITDAPESFFRQTFFTFDHAETIEAVAERVADGGAVDSYVWEHLKRTNPHLTNQTRVIDSSRQFGFPPVVTRRGSDAALTRRMADALYGMEADPDGAALLAALDLDRFAPHPPSLYDGIADMAAALATPSWRTFVP